MGPERTPGPRHRCGGTLDPRSGVCDRCGSSGPGLAAVVAAVVVGALLPVLGARDWRLAVAWVAVASVAAAALLIRGRRNVVAVRDPVLWLAACGGFAGAALAWPFLHRASTPAYLRPRLLLLLAVELVAAIPTAWIALGG